jgi:diaminopimelate decarboxylase
MNRDNDLFLNSRQIDRIARRYPTPFHIYDEQGIRDSARRLNNAFSWAPEFKNYFAVKACPNPSIVNILRQEGCGADCSSAPELTIARRAGIKEENIMFTSNNTPASEFRRAFKQGAILNLDDITHIPFLIASAGAPEVISFRYNPGPLRETAEGNVIGKPEEAKYGLTKDQLF